MTNIQNIELTEDDKEILDKIDEKDLQRMIDFLRDYKEAMWWNNDTNELVKESELPHKLIHQPLPDYPREFKIMGMYFSRITKNGRKYLEKEGFFETGSLASEMLGTLWSPTLICTFIADAYRRDRFCDGLFGFGVSNGLYLKALLHLQDLKRYYEYIKEN